MIKTALSLRVAIAITTFFLNVLAAKLLGVSGVGELSEILAFCMITTCVLCIGMEHSAIYYSSKYNSKKNVKAIIHILFFYSIGVSSAFYVLAMHLLEINALTACLIFVFIIQAFLYSVSIGAGEAVKVNFLYLVVNGLLLAFYFLSYYFFKKSYTYTEVLFFLVLSNFTIVFFTSFYFGFFYEPGCSDVQSNNQSLFLSLIRYGIKAYPGSLAGVLKLRLPIIIIGFTFGSEAAGHYAISQVFLESSFIIPVLIGSLLTKKVSEKSNMLDKKLELLKFLKNIVLYSILCSIAFLFLIGFVVDFLYGSGFSESVSYIKSLVFIPLLFSISKMLQSFFNGINKPGVSSVSEFIALSAMLIFLVSLKLYHSVYVVIYSLVFSYFVQVTYLALKFRTVTRNNAY